jgi:hypothetical protein
MRLTIEGLPEIMSLLTDCTYSFMTARKEDGVSYTTMAHNTAMSAFNYRKGAAIAKASNVSAKHTHYTLSLALYATEVKATAMHLL